MKRDQDQYDELCEQLVKLDDTHRAVANRYHAAPCESNQTDLCGPAGTAPGR